MEHQEKELVLHSIDQVNFFHHLRLDLFLLLQLMLVQIVHQHKHLNKVEQIEYDLYKYEQLQKRLSNKLNYFMYKIEFRFHLLVFDEYV
jgi:hypothetical protein